MERNGGKRKGSKQGVVRWWVSVWTCAPVRVRGKDGARKTFFVTKIILVAAPTNDTGAAFLLTSDSAVVCHSPKLLFSAGVVAFHASVEL